MRRCDEYQYSEEAHERNLMIIWECDTCGRSHEQPPGTNENGPCDHCENGFYQQAGETYDL